MKEKIDLYSYAGVVNMQGYHALCRKLKEKKAEKALLALATPGGDPHAGFRLARALQHGYGSFSALVPRYCKSAGTLIILGASDLYMADMSELGPLDVQIKKGDELYGRNSGLDIFEAISFLKLQTMETFREQLQSLIADGLSTKVASDIASKLTRGIYEPIATQIDPMKLAEFQRANDITMAYGVRLAEVGKNLSSSYSLASLIAQYPSHGFVIDRKEARQIFAKVKEPTDDLIKICEDINKETLSLINSDPPTVTKITVEIDLKEDEDVNSDETQAVGSGSTSTSKPKISRGNGKVEPSKEGSGTGADSEEVDQRQSGKSKPAANQHP